MSSHPMGPLYGGVPHRFPMLLVDAVEALAPGHGQALKQVSANEVLLERPGDGPPTLPFPLLVDALGQVAILLLRGEDAAAASVWYLGGIEAMAFGPAIPAGSSLRLEARVLKKWRTTARVEVKAWSGSVLAASGFMVLSQGGSERNV